MAAASAEQTVAAAPPAAVLEPQAPRTVRDLPAGAVARMSAVKAESGTAARRAAGAVVLRPLTTMAALAAEAEVPPLQDTVAEMRRLTAHADYGERHGRRYSPAGSTTARSPAKVCCPPRWSSHTSTSWHSRAREW
eukprot:2072351-Pleurochrysis_carterae.AAC.1